MRFQFRIDKFNPFQGAGMKFLPLALLTLISLVACNKKPVPLVEIPRPSKNSEEIPKLNDPRSAPDLNQFNPAQQNPAIEKPPTPPTGQMSLAEFGIKEYPAALKENQKRVIDHKGEENTLTLTFSTKDSPTKVADFYSQQIKSNRSKSVTKDTAVVGGTTSKSANAFIVASKSKDKTQVTITATLKKSL